MLVNGKINGKDAGIYIICQCIGAIIAAALLLAVMSGLPAYSIAANGLGQNGYGDASPGGFSMMSGLIAEVILTFIFLIVIFGATSKAAPAGFAGMAIGLSLTLIHIVGIPVHRRIGQPCPEYRACPSCRGYSPCPALALHHRPDRRCGARGLCLEIPAGRVCLSGMIHPSFSVVSISVPLTVHSDSGFSGYPVHGVKINPVEGLPAWQGIPRFTISTVLFLK